MSREARESNTEARQVPYNASARPSATAGRAMVEDLPATICFKSASGNPATHALLDSYPFRLNFTFRRLHEVLQVAFGWTGSHIYTFDVNNLAAQASSDSLEIELCLPW